MTLLILGALYLGTLLLVARRDGRAGVSDGIGTSLTMLRRVAPMVLLGLLLASMIREVLPVEIVSRWMGDEAGLTGILIGAAVGAVITGGPFVILPLMASLASSGAGAGALAAFVTAWSVIPLNRTLVWELPFMGGAFTAARYLVMLPFPVIVGLLTPPIYGWLLEF